MKFLFIVSYSIFFCIICYPQDTEPSIDITNQLTAYARNIITFNREHPQEKVYLQLDNRSYYIGDTIWFKAYIVNAVSLRPTHTSGILYVELLNEDGIEMEHRKLHITNGMCHGEFPLRKDYRTGYYEIRAYTRNMLNFGNEESADIRNFYEETLVSNDVEELFEWGKKTLSVFSEIEQEEKDTKENRSKEKFSIKQKDTHLNSKQSLITDYNHTIFSRVFPVYLQPEEKGAYKKEMNFYPMHTLLSLPKETEIDIRPDTLKLSFFPEGGTLVTDVPSVVAFETTDQWGRKREIDGYIANSKGERITLLKTAGRGRGTFSLCPKLGEKYFAHVIYKGEAYKFKLPRAEKQGYVIHLTPPINDGDAMFRVQTSSNTPRELLGWTLQCRGALTAFDTLSIDNNGNSTVVIPAIRLYPGVNQLTLFNAQGRVLSDRLFFVCPPTQTAILSLSQLPENVAPYEKVKLDFNVNNGFHFAPQCNFSLSITDADELVNTYDTRDIRSELLLSSDLKGFIEDVDSYFNHNNIRKMTADIDLLMLVQGWRRYEWQTMTDSSYIPKYTYEKDLLLDGYVITDLVSSNESYLDANKYPRIPNLNMKIELRSPTLHFVDTCSTDSLGRFHLDIKHPFYDEVQMTILLGKNEKDKKWHHHILVPKTSLKFCYPIIYRAFSPMFYAYTYYQWNTPEQDAIRTTDEHINWTMEGLIDNVMIKKRRKRRSGINYENPDMTIDYYKEWNNVIDRGVPLLNYYKILHKKDYRFLQEEDVVRGIKSEKNYTKDINPYIFLNYSLAGRMGMHLDYEQILMHDSICYRYKENFRKPYFMPRTIKIYSNLISRELEGRIKDPSTGHRLNAHFVVEYFSKEESPIHPPYMPKEGRRDTYFEGYSRVASFYSPDYSNCALPDTADYRRTLLWVPNVETDFYGNASVTFYNNKQTKHLHVRAEGITSQGEFVVYDSAKQ